MEGLRPIVAEHHYFGSVLELRYMTIRNKGSRESTLGFLFAAAGATLTTVCLKGLKGLKGFKGFSGPSRHSCPVALMALKAFGAYGPVLPRPPQGGRLASTDYSLLPQGPSED